MIDELFYAACGLLMYVHKHGNSFDFSKPLFWGTVFGWPVVLGWDAIKIWTEIFEESRKDKL